MANAKIYIGINEENENLVFQIKIEGEIVVSGDCSKGQNCQLEKILFEELSKRGVQRFVLVNGRKYDAEKRVYTDIKRISPFEESAMRMAIQNFYGGSLIKTGA